MQIEQASVKSHNQLVSDIRKLHTGLARYKERSGFYPTTEQGLQALVTEPSTDPRPSGWQQFTEQVPIDPWGVPYVYRCPGLKDPTRYDLYSAGPDRFPDTADDDWGQ